MKIGVLSLQGGVIEHLNHITALGAEGIEVKTASDLDEIDGLILPGGESTTISKILNAQNMMEPLKQKIQNGLCTWGTCAGMILLAKHLENDSQNHLGVMDITIKRNAYGTQLDSFETNALIEEVSNEPIPLVFIRAPYVTKVGEGVKVLYKVDSDIVAVQQKNILATAFHPELTPNLEFHQYFLNMIREKNDIQ